MSLPPNQISIFLSYAREDEGWLNKLATHLSLLQRQRIISLWHDRLIAPGTNWTYTIDQYLETASVILLLVSSDFFASDYCVGIEMKRALERQEAGEALVIPILVRSVDWNHAPFSHLHVLPTDAKPLASWQDEDMALADVTAGIRQAIENMSQFSANAPRAALPAIWNIPYSRNPFFMGREDLLSHLYTQLQRNQPLALSQHPQAISGLGGIGKTQVAVEYAYRFHQEYQVVFWAQAESRETFISSYVTFATLLNLPEQNEQEYTIIVQAVKRWLQFHRKWLLILDNADELALVPEFLPPVLGGHLLLTTRAQTMGRLANRIEVEGFSTEQGALFLLRRTGLLAHDATLVQTATDNRQRAMQITEALGGLPLALDQAGAFIEETGVKLSAYLSLYQTRRKDLLQRRGAFSPGHPEAVATTWSLSFQQIEQADPAIVDLLHLSAYLAPDVIPEAIITEGFLAYDGPLAQLVEDPLRFNEAIAVLQRYSLVQRNRENSTLNIHRLVQTVLQDAMTLEERHGWAKRAVRVVERVFSWVDRRTLKQAQLYLPHAEICASWIGQYTFSFPEAGSLLYTLGRYFYQTAHYEQAEAFYRRALSIRERVLGPEHPDTATTLQALAGTYMALSKHEQAEPFYRRALSIRERVLGPEHPDTATIMHQSARLYQAQGKYGQAEPLYQRALRISEQTLGPEHPDTVITLQALASLYQAQGKYEQAEPFFQHALHILEQVLEPTDRRMGTILHSLARFNQEQGKYEHAESLYRRALHIAEQWFDSEHPEIAKVLSELATLYLVQGKYEHAEPLYQRALRIWEQSLGLDHPLTRHVQEQYQDLLQKMKSKRNKNPKKGL